MEASRSSQIKFSDIIFFLLFFAAKQDDICTCEAEIYKRGQKMKKISIFLAIVFAITTAAASATALYNKEDLSKILITENDIPSGFVIGKIPEPAQKVLKENPWYFDNQAIKKLTERIYPDGDYRKVTDVHMTIIAEEKKPYNDNIVCYVILYKDIQSAKDELKKLKQYVSFNNDRALLITKDNMAVFLHVDDVSDFHHIQDMALNMESKLKSL